MMNISKIVLFTFLNIYFLNMVRSQRVYENYVLNNAHVYSYSASEKLLKDSNFRSEFAEPESILVYLMSTDKDDERNGVVYHPNSKAGKKSSSLNKLTVIISDKKEFKKLKVELNHRLTFISFKGDTSTMIKFKIYDGNDLLGIKSWLFQYESNRWYLVDMPKEYRQIARFIREIRSEFIISLLVGSKSNDKIVREAIEETRFNNGFDLDLYLQLLYQWNRNKEENKIFYLQENIFKLMSEN